MMVPSDVACERLAINGTATSSTAHASAAATNARRRTAGM
jgi:hypothetical protein